MADEIIQPYKPKQVHGIFAGVIDQIAVQRLANMVSIASQQGVDEIHLLFQTTGGIIGDGICLYNLFRATRIEIFLYNAGNVASIGVIAYLGADSKLTSANAAFMIHKTVFSPVAATVDRLQSAANAAVIDDQRVETILHEHINLAQEKWDIHKVSDLWLSAEDSVEARLADSIGNFSRPMGEQIYYVGQS
jgi:ATP-dependent protease ClpP protease subunit